MISRRSLLQFALTAPLGQGRRSALTSNPAGPAPGSPAARAWAGARLDVFGSPRSWWHVERGFYPFSPERTLVFRQRPKNAFYGELKRQLLAAGYGVRPYFSEQKLDYAMAIVRGMAEYYRAPEVLEDWTTGLCARENLGPALGHMQGWGFIHQFQRPGGQKIPTANTFLDWWLVLLPGGVDLGSLDQRPTHVLAGLVQSSPTPHRDAAFFIPMCHVIDATAAGVEAVAQMDRIAAAQHLNGLLLEGLPAAEAKLASINFPEVV